ncbi:PAS domain-containing sensor histidine kinase [Marinobacter nauticus]
MVNSRNFAVFWLCAVIALAISLGSIGLVILYDAATTGIDSPGRISLRPGGGLVSLALSAGFLALAFRARILAIGISICVLVLAGLLVLLPWLASGGPLASLAIKPLLMLVTGLMAASILSSVLQAKGSLVGLIAGPVITGIGLLSLLSNWYPELSGFSLGSIAESTIVVSPLVMISGATLPFLQRIYELEHEHSYRGLVAVGAIGIVLTTFGWHVLRMQQSDYLLERARSLADQLEASSVSAYSVKLSLIRRLAERWELLDGLPNQAFWRQEVVSYLRDFPELRLLAVLDPKLRPALVESRDLQYRFWLHDFLRRDNLHDWLLHVIEAKSPHMSAPMDTADGRAHAAIAVPITPRPGLSWTVLAVVDLSHVYAGLTQHLDTGLNVRISASDHTLFDTAPDTPDSEKSLLISQVVNAHHDSGWRIDVSMPRGQLPADELYLPPLVLFSGIGLSFLMMLSQLFWRESERRSESLQMLNNTLNYHLEQERQLRHTNERILEFSRDILCSISRDGHFLQISPACEDILGYAPDELINQHYDLILVPEDRASTENEVLLLVSGEHDRASGFRTRLRHKDGRIVTISWTSEWSTADQALFCVGRDITDELVAETLTRERDQFFSLSPDMFCIVDLNSYFFEVNTSFVETLGYSREELLGTSYMTLVHEDDQKAVVAAVQGLTEGRDVTELQIRALDTAGREHWLNINAILSADDLIYVVARDTTEQRKIEQQLLQNEALLKMAERVAMLGGWAVELDTGKVTWSDAVCALHDLPPGESPTVEQAIQYYIPEHREIISHAVQTCIDTGIPFDEELQIRTAKGRLRWVRAIGHGVKGPDGKIELLQGATQDITSTRQTMDQLRRFAERQATIFESITDAFFTLDRDWRFTYVNTRSEELLRKTRDELLGHSIWEMFPAAVGSEFEQHYRQAMETGESVSFEGYYAPLDNWLEVSAYPSDEGLAVYYRSIRERKEAQWQLEATMEELERSNRELQDFAFVASHDLQEPLRKIQAFSDRLISRSEKLDDQEKDYLRRMQSAASRMQSLIDDLLSYSRVTTRAKPMVSCNTQAILEEVLQDMETSIAREQARIITTELPSTYGDATQLRQVIQNLLSNAVKFHAPDRKPEIRIESENITDTHWTMVVQDNGIGFDERYAEKLFHPFQRLHQKDGYKGTGIGMAIVKKILDRHGATVTVNSKPGEGTTFRMCFKRG